MSFISILLSKCQLVCICLKMKPIQTTSGKYSWSLWCQWLLTYLVLKYCKHTHAYSLLCLNWIHWSHVITGNITAATSGKWTCLPPISFAERQEKRKSECFFVFKIRFLKISLQIKYSETMCYTGLGASLTTDAVLLWKHKYIYLDYCKKVNKII